MADGEILLTIYLQYASRRTDARPLCKRLLAETGSLQNLIHLPPHHLESAFGLSEIQAVAIYNLGLISDRLQMTTKPKEELQTLPQLYQHLKPYFTAANYEKTIIICMNQKQQYLATEICTLYHPLQTVASSSLVLELARRHHAATIILAHNHPNTSVVQLRPSSADLAGTNAICGVLKAYNITLLDHILMAYDGCQSILHSPAFYRDPQTVPAFPELEEFIAAAIGHPI